MTSHPMHRCLLLMLTVALGACASTPPPSGDRYDLLIRNGSVHDGSGAAPQRIDVGVRGDRIVALLPAGNDAQASLTLDANGRAVAPGFINVLSWATESL